MAFGQVSETRPRTDCQPDEFRSRLTGSVRHARLAAREVAPLREHANCYREAHVVDTAFSFRQHGAMPMSDEEVARYNVLFERMETHFQALTESVNVLIERVDRH